MRSTLVTVFLPDAVEVEEGRSEKPLLYYQQNFEASFLLETGLYYRKEAARIVTELSCSDYLRHVVGQLQTAKRAGARFLHQTSVTKVRLSSVKEQCLIIENAL